MEAKDLPKIVISLSIVAFVVAYVAWPAINGLSNQSTTSLVSAESVNSSIWGTAINIGHPNVVASSVVVYNASMTMTSYNYTVSAGDGSTMSTITFRNGTEAGGALGNRINNNSIYSLNYNYGTVDSGVSTLGRIVVGIMFFLAIIIYIFVKIIGIDVI